MLNTHCRPLLEWAVKYNITYPEATVPTYTTCTQHTQFKLAATKSWELAEAIEPHMLLRSQGALRQATEATALGAALGKLHDSFVNQVTLSLSNDRMKDDIKANSLRYLYLEKDSKDYTRA